MAQLAINSHTTRGDEVIEILEMMGGVNAHNLYGDKNYAYYTIDSDKEIKGGIYIFDNEDLLSFTIEEFEEKFPYKVGDKVKVCGDNLGVIISMRWESDYVVYKVKFNKNGYETSKTSENLQPYKEETMDRKYDIEEYLKVWKETEKGLEVVVNDRFELKEDNGKFYIIKKQPQYPKTYEECCDILQLEHTFELKDLTIDEEKLTDSFIRLKRCRDAYWKIAGEQMGMSEPWKPASKNIVHYIYYSMYDNEIQVSCGNLFDNEILAFPTAEMCDVFYENFKELIELCKELL